MKYLTWTAFVLLIPFSVAGAAASKTAAGTTSAEPAADASAAAAKAPMTTPEADAVPTPSVHIESGQVSIKADNVPLLDVLSELAEQAGFDVIYNEKPTDDETVSVDFSALPWREAIDTVVTERRYALSMDANDTAPFALVVFTKREASASSETEMSAATLPVTPPPGSATPESSMAEASRIAALLLARQQSDPIARLLTKLSDEQHKVDALQTPPENMDPRIAKMLRDDALEEYSSSLRGLGDFTDPAAIQDPRLDRKLYGAIGARDSDVRTSALVALQSRGVRDGGQLSRIRELVTNDPDPDVRRQALEVYVRYGESQEVLPFVQELGRAANPVQDIAVREWIRIEREAEELRTPAGNAAGEQGEEAKPNG